MKLTIEQMEEILFRWESEEVKDYCTFCGEKTKDLTYACWLRKEKKCLEK